MILERLRLIFLDVDGVLNRHESHPILKYCTIEKDLAENFNQLLWQTDSMFVLSSAWRYLYLGGSMEESGLRNLLLSHWVDGYRLKGVTEKDEVGVGYNPDNRGKQITDWLVRSELHKTIQDFRYMVIDDMDLGISEAGHPFLKVFGDQGFTKESLATAINMLTS